MAPGYWVQFINRNFGKLLVGTTVGACVVNALPQTLFLYRYRNFLAEHKDGVEQELSPQLNELVQKVYQRILLPAENEANIHVFPCIGLDTVHKGSCVTRTGGIIGLPRSYNYMTKADIEKDKLMLSGKAIDWESDAGRLLSQAIVLSTKAKAFGVAREINYSHTNHIIVDSLATSVFIAGAYTTCYYANHFLGLSGRLKLWGQVGIYGFICLTFTLLEMTLVDGYFCFRDNRVDRKTAKLGKDLAEGGVEFYHKILMKNQALRLLMGAEGPSHYTPYGNEKSTWRNRHVQLSKRRDNLVKYLKEYEKDSDQCDICEQISGKPSSQTKEKTEEQ